MPVDKLYKSSDIADRIKFKAREKNILMKDLLKTCGLGINTVSKLADGKDIYSKNLAKIADCLNCSVDYILGRTDDPMLHSLSESMPQKSEDIINAPPSVKSTSTIMLRYYDQPTSAGFGLNISDDVPYKYINVPDSPAAHSADFIVRVSGDSMMPRFLDGDKLFVKTCDSIEEGEFGVFIVNGESYVKKCGKGELISLNSDYENINLADHDSVYCAGKVIGKLVVE